MTLTFDYKAIIVPPKRRLPFGGSFRKRAARMMEAARNLWAAYWLYRDRRAVAATLLSLDDRTLADMGLVRSELNSCGRLSQRSRHGCSELHWLPGGRR